jgi:hypothetical protein
VIWPGLGLIDDGMENVLHHEDRNTVTGPQTLSTGRRGGS